VRRLLGSLFASAAALRVAAYERGLVPRAHLAGPVVSVGNLGVGGSGKTPVVRRVAEILRDGGAPVAVLSRGYAGSFRGAALVVSDGWSVAATVEEAGDEPVMLARALPGVVVAVGRRRAAAGREVEARFGRRVHVLDDGFQHLRLARDLDLVCVDVADLDDRPLPAGRLRERPGALARASLVLLTRVEAASEDELRGLETRLGRERTLRVRRRVVGFRTLVGAEGEAPARAFLLAAIARPERLAHDAAAQGCAVVGRAFFRDHHRFTAAELADVSTRAAEAGADAILTTAKDAVRLPPSPAGGRVPFVVLEVAAELDPKDEERLRERLLALARRVA
jgi:tetraacyldisaccharide 4'-kinase